MRKGEHGSLVVYADKIIRTETDSETGEEAERAIPFMKGYTVFNVEQIEGLPEHYYAKPAPRGETVQRIERAESFFAATGAKVVHGGSRRLLCRSRTDHVQMPCIDFFRDAESYYATLAHEMTHWTRHPSRLDRDFGRKRFGDEGYAMEELVAELGSAFLSADLELTPEVREDHAAYIALVDQGAEGRQARDFHRRIPCAARGGFPARLAETGGGIRRRLIRPWPSLTLCYIGSKFVSHPTRDIHGKTHFRLPHQTCLAAGRSFPACKREAARSYGPYCRGYLERHRAPA